MEAPTIPLPSGTTILGLSRATSVQYCFFALSQYQKDALSEFAKVRPSSVSSRIVEEKSFVSTISFINEKIFSNNSNEDISMFYSFVSGGCVQILLEWIKGNMQTPMEELSKKLNKLISVTYSFFNTK